MRSPRVNSGRTAAGHDLAALTAQDPDAVAVITEGRSINYGQFSRDIDRLRGWMAERLSNGDRRIGIVLPHEYWNWVAHLAAWALGRQVLSLREADSAAIAHALRVDVVTCDHQRATRYAGLSTLIPELSFDSTPVHPLVNQGSGVKQQWEEPVASLDDSVPMRVVLTSGTTGVSRSVLWSEATTLARVTQLQQSLQLSNQTRVYAFQHIGTTGGFRYPLARWRSGGTVLLRGSDVGFEATRAVVAASNLLVTAPANLRTLTQQWPKAWPGRETRQLIMAGGRLSRPLLEKALENVACSVSLAYGSTETGSVATGDASLIERHPGAVGFVRGGVEVQIVDAQHEPLAPGTVGTVRIKTPYMVNQYEPVAQHGVPSADVFKDGWFYPGDRGLLDPDGFLAIEGRTGDVVNLGGAKLSLSALEQKLELLPGVHDLCVLLLPLPDGDRIGVMVVTNTPTSDTELHRGIRKVVKPSTPYTLIRAEQIERNAMGKVPRTQLAEKVVSLMVKQTRERDQRTS